MGVYGNVVCVQGCVVYGYTVCAVRVFVCVNVLVCVCIHGWGVCRGVDVCVCVNGVCVQGLVCA